MNKDNKNTELDNPPIKNKEDMSESSKPEEFEALLDNAIEVIDATATDEYDDGGQRYARVKVEFDNGTVEFDDVAIADRHYAEGMPDDLGGIKQWIKDFVDLRFENFAVNLDENLNEESSKDQIDKLDLKEANQKLQHEMSSVHQILNSEAKVLERYLKHYGIEHKELWETVDVIKRTCEKSKSILKKHYEETGVPINAT